MGSEMCIRDRNLLYRFERPQYVEMRKLHGPKMGDGDVGSSGTSRSDTKGRGARKSSAAPAAEDTVQPASLEMEASEIYGAEHLLRLFGRWWAADTSEPAWDCGAHEYGCRVGGASARAPHCVPRVLGAGAKASVCRCV